MNKPNVVVKFCLIEPKKERRAQKRARGEAPRCPVCGRGMVKKGLFTRDLIYYPVYQCDYVLDNEHQALSRTEKLERKRAKMERAA